MAESFDNAVKRLEDYYDERQKSLSCQQGNKWSTTPDSSYSDMLANLESTDLSQAYQAHYQELIADAPGGKATKEQSLRWQTTFVANVRRAIRNKFVCSVDCRMSSVDQTRYAYNDTFVTKALLRRTKGLVTSKEGSS